MPYKQLHPHHTPLHQLGTLPVELLPKLVCPVIPVEVDHFLTFGNQILHGRSAQGAAGYRLKQLA